MNVTVYMVLLPTGLVNEDGIESVIVIDVKLTMASAEAVALKHDGAIVEKRRADKLT